MATTYTNQAFLSYNGTVRPSNIVTGVINDVLSATKTAAPDTYSTDDVITYVITLVNTSPTAFTDLTVTDNLGSYTFGTQTLTPLTYVPNSVIWTRDGVPQTTPLTVTVTDNTLTFEGVSVSGQGAGTGVTEITYQARVNEFAPIGTATSTVTNTVSVTGTTVTTSVTAEETITATTTLDLSIFKSLSPNPVPENGQLTYTFLVQNFGSEAGDATDNISITDTFSPYLADITVTLDGTVLPDTDYTYTNAGVFTLNAGVITVPAATFTQDAITGAYTVTPGTATVTVTGTIATPPTI